jgi:hypothetical protein
VCAPLCTQPLRAAGTAFSSSSSGRVFYQGLLLEMHDRVKKRVDVCLHSIIAVGGDGNVIVTEQFLIYL